MDSVSTISFLKPTPEVLSGTRLNCLAVLFACASADVAKNTQHKNEKERRWINGMSILFKGGRIQCF